MTKKARYRGPTQNGWITNHIYNVESHVVESQNNIINASSYVVRAVEDVTDETNPQSVNYLLSIRSPQEYKRILKFL